MGQFTIFNSETDVVENQRVIVSSGIFSAGAGSLTAFYTSSLQGNQSASFVNVYDKAEGDATREVQFACGFASHGGSGSLGNTTKTAAGNRETAAIYRQFANVLLPPGTEKFVFTGDKRTLDDTAVTSGSNEIYFIVMNRARQREKMDPGNWELHLSKSFDSHFTANELKLIDDSGATTTPTVNQAGRVFNIVSGSISSGASDIDTAAVTATAPGGSYGNFYPDLGIMILDAHKIQENVHSQVTMSLNTNAFDNTQREFFKAIQKGVYFAARREEEITSTMYFCRANNKEFNFSNNPTFTTGSAGQFTQATFEGDPKTYITQIGLYNDSDELLAIAKLSQPVLKSFSREAVIKVKLDF